MCRETETQTENKTMPNDKTAEEQIEEILEDAKTTALAAIMALFDDDDDEGSDDEEGAEEEGAEEEDGEEEEEAADDDGEEAEVDLPDLQAINKMPKAKAAELCEQLGIEIDDDEKTSGIRKLLAVVHHISEGDPDEVEEDDMVHLANCVGIEVDEDDNAVTLERLQEYFNTESDDDDEPEATDDEEEADDDVEEVDEEADDDEESDDEESDDEESDDEEEADEEAPDYEAVAKKFRKFPSDAVMRKRIKEWNEHQDEDDHIVPAKGKLKAAYRKLVAMLVDYGGEITDWGTPYIREEATWCCGVEMPEKKVRGVKEDCCVCAITGKVFYVDDESEFVPVKVPKPAAKKAAVAKKPAPKKKPVLNKRK